MALPPDDSVILPDKAKGDVGDCSYFDDEPAVMHCRRMANSDRNNRLSRDGRFGQLEMTNSPPGAPAWGFTHSVFLMQKGGKSVLGRNALFDQAADFYFQKLGRWFTVRTKRSFAINFPALDAMAYR